MPSSCNSFESSIRSPTRFTFTYAPVAPLRHEHEHLRRSDRSSILYHDLDYRQLFLLHPYFASSTSSSATATYTGDDTYPVFPNSVYLSRFALVNAADSGLTTQDQELYNYCYLLLNSVIYTYNKRQASSTSSPTSNPTPRATYLIGKPPCKRQGSIGTNCYFQNTNHTFRGLTPYSDPQSETALAEQQTCFCSTYPFFDSALGCQACFEQHGGIEGYH